MDDAEKRAKAKAQVQTLTGFYIHLAAFVGVLVLLFIINAAASDVWWVQWVFLGWGAFVAAHAVAVFADVPGRIRQWQDQKTRELADKM